MGENGKNLSLETLENDKSIPPVGEKNFGDQKKRKPEKKYNEQAVRESESYQTFLEMLNSGETNQEQLKSFAYPDRTMSAVSKMFNGSLKDIYSQENGEVEKMAAQLLIKDINTGKVKTKAPYEDPLPGVRKAYLKSKYFESQSPRQSEIYEFLDQLYVKGMTREQMKAEFFGKPEDVKLAPEAKTYMADPDWQKTLKLFLRDLNPAEAEFLAEDEVSLIDKGDKTLKDSSSNGKSEKVDMRAKKENPAARILSKILPAQLGSFKKTGDLLKNNFKLDEKLDQTDWAEVSKALVEGLKSVWQDFYYSGRWLYGKKNPGDKENSYYLGSEADTDAAASLYFFRKAGLDKVLNATALPHGAELPPGVVVDMGYTSGLKSRVNTAGQTTIIADNHQRERGFKTSTAIVFFNIFNDCGLFNRQAEAETDSAKKFNPEIGRALAQITVDDDNANMINNVNQFLSSKSTLRGLHRTMNIEDIYKFLDSKLNLPLDNSEEKNSHKKLWRWHEGDYQKVLDTPLTKEELKEYDLVEESAKQGQSIFEAREWFYKKNGQESKSVKKTDDELVKEGTVVTTEINGQTMRWVVNLIGFNKEKRLRAGHDAVKVNGFDGLISYNPGRMSFMVNTVNDNVDLSKILNLKQGVPVRGAMWVKPLDGTPLTVSLKDILNQLAPNYVPQGKVKDYLEKGGLIKPTPGKVAAEEKSTGGEPKKKLGRVEPVVVKTISAQPVQVDTTPQAEDKKLFVSLDKVTPKVFEHNGLKFSRKVTEAEMKIVEQIDNKIKQVLLKHIEPLVRGRYKLLSVEDQSKILQEHIELGLEDENIREQIKNRYVSAGLPILIDK
ncbi:MAG: hypothetical protein HY973_03335 [Candidatus Kerfeldbacteria bacterium]|nr:hypothetical protein [Candidatus Kerfeldbacteria bacterium]